MRHTVASVERRFFTDSPSPEKGHQDLEGMEELAGVRLGLSDFWPAAACRSLRQEPSMAGTARGAAVIEFREVVSGSLAKPEAPNPAFERLAASWQDDRRAIGRRRLDRGQLIRPRELDPALRVSAFDRAGLPRRRAGDGLSVQDTGVEAGPLARATDMIPAQPTLAGVFFSVSYS